VWAATFIQKSGNWNAANGQMIKEITYRVAKGGPPRDVNLKYGEREGTNEHGQNWTEEWERNDVTGYKKWNKTTHESKHLRKDGFDSKWGEWREEFKGEPINGERWTEMFKEEDDYWERKSERYTEYPR
jgi:hypothetical protein